MALILVAAMTAGRLGAGMPSMFQEQKILGRFQFRAYSADEGLNSLGIWALAQDRDGYIWVGTDAGLYRFNGQVFHHWGSRHGLKGDLVQQLAPDPSGGMWFVTEDGLQHIRDGVVRHLGQPEGLPAERVYSIATDPQGRLWVAFVNAIYRREADGGFHKLDRIPLAPDAMADAPRHGGMAMCTLDAAAVLKPDGSWVRWGPSQGLGPELRAIQEDGEGRLWVLGARGLYMKPLGGDRFECLTHPVLTGSGERLRALCGDGKGGIWASTGAGLLHVHGREWSVLGTAQGLPTTGAGLVLVDHERNLWYAGTGLFRQLGLGAWRNYTTEQGLPTDLTWGMARDAQGTLWAGTDRGLAWLDARGWHALPETLGTSVVNLLRVGDGTVAAITNHNRVVKLSASPGPRRLLRFGEDRDPYFSLWTTPAGDLWAHGYRRLVRLEERQGRLQVAEALPVPREAAGNLAGSTCDGEGRVWFVTDRGLNEYHAGQWRRWDRSQGLLADSLGALLALPDGSYLVCYRDSLGVTRFVREANRLRVLRHYRESDGSLPTDAVFSAHLDPAGRIWLNTNVGAVLLQEDGFRVFGRSSGFMNHDMVQGSFWADPGGDLWFGSGGGIVRFEPSAYAWDLPSPRPVLAEVRFGTSLHPLTPAHPPRIRPADNTAEFHFGCLSYSREKTYRFETQLAGLDPNWRVERVPQTRFPALPPGAYTLNVRVRSDGRPGPTLSYAFQILPRWYQTWTFRALSFLALGPALWGLLGWRNRRLKVRNQQLEAVVKARTADLETANRILEEQSLHDPLTGLWNRRYLSLVLPEQVAQAQRVLQPDKRKTMHRDLFPDHPLLFMILDIDHFKWVNDEYGHQAGDEVLKGVADLLRELMRESDTVARWGGEEFLVVARQVGQGDPAALAERIRKTMEDHAFELEDGRILKKTISIGFCPFPLGFEAPVLPWEKAVLLADRALYAAKRNGRNGWMGLAEGPAFSAAVLEASAGHPDIPDLLARHVLHIEHSFEDLGPDLWI